MSADHVDPLLAGFHLGLLDDPELDGIESHLSTCVPCLEAYLRLKRRMDHAGPDDARPSAPVRERLRSDVAARLGPRRSLRRRWVAVGAAVAAALVLGIALLRRGPVTAAPPPSPLIDSAATSPLL